MLKPNRPGADPMGMDTNETTHTLTQKARPADPWPNASIAPPKVMVLRTTPKAAPAKASRTGRLVVALLLLMAVACIAVGSSMAHQDKAAQQQFCQWTGVTHTEACR